SDRIGSRPLMAAGLALQSGAIAWLASVSSPTVPYSHLVVPFVMAGTGMALVFAPTANAVLGAVRPQEAGQASGATNAIRGGGGGGLLLVARRRLDALVGERLPVEHMDLRELQPPPVAHMRGAVDRHRDDRRAAEQREPPDPPPRLLRELAGARAPALGVHGD